MRSPLRWSINGRFLSQTQTGVQRYAGEITRALDARLSTDEGLAHAMTWDICVPADAPQPPHFDVIKVRRSAFGHGHSWEQTVLPAMASGGLVSFANLGPFAHGRQILCLHDANVFLEPTSYTKTFRAAYRAAFPILARRVRAVTTVSHFSAAMLKSFGVTGTRRTTVIPNGHEHALRWDGAASRFHIDGAFDRPFVFALGSRAKHKQIDLLLGLAPALDALGIDVVVSGSSNAIFAQTKAENRPNVRSVGFVSDDDLAALFAKALCFAFPSRTEGFGLPLLEAMVHGAPIITSDCASMPEVCGNAALYAPPDEPMVWLDRIRQLAESPSTRSMLAARGRERYKRFSWAESAGHYIHLAQCVAPGGLYAGERSLRTVSLPPIS